jgi:hypothetical protein
LACFFTEEAVFEAACEESGTLLSLIQESNSEHLITMAISYFFDWSIRVGHLASVAVAAGKSLSSISGNDNNWLTTTQEQEYRYACGCLSLSFVGVLCND